MNEDMTLTAYARTRGISIQAASQSFKRHRQSMTDMYSTKGRAIVLTEDGVKYLDHVRAKLPALAESPETIAALRDRIRTLESQIGDQAEELRRKDERILALEQLVDRQSNQLLFQSQQFLQLTMKKKGVVQRIREWFVGTDGDVLQSPEGEQKGE